MESSAIENVVLVVDDELIGREMLVENLSDEGYSVLQAENGTQAWVMLEQHADVLDAILLDRMMPDMDGIEILRRVKEHPVLRDVPVIMQTGMTNDEDVLEGLQAGAYYYLTKPYAADTLLAIVAAAVRDCQGHRALVKEVARQGRSMACLTSACFHFQTPEEARDLAALVANAAPEPGRVVLGLSELMLNAIEHGNLAIGYDEKSRLIDEARLFDFIAERLKTPDFAKKRAVLEIQRDQTRLTYRICDEGNGFDWQNYLEMSPERAFDTHGRGIAMSKMISFDTLEYRGCGNEVIATVCLR